jgi:hypothetical protein
MELRWQLATKTMEVSTTQGHEGNVAWLKRHLREAQDTIIQLREAQRLTKERHTNYSIECEVIERKPTWLSPAREKNESNWRSSLCLHT